MSSYSMFNGPEPSEEEIEQMDVDDYEKWAAANEKRRNHESRIVYLAPGRYGSIEIHGKNDAEKFIQHFKEYCDKVFSGDPNCVDESLSFIPNVPMKRKKRIDLSKIEITTDEYLATHVFVDGVEIKNIMTMEYRHEERDIPMLNIGIAVDGACVRTLGSVLVHTVGEEKESPKTDE